MGIRIRSTEQHPHPMWTKLESAFTITEVQGFIFQCTDKELIASTKASSKNIPIHCIEAVEYDEPSEFSVYSIFNKEEWINKINAARFFDSKLIVITHCTSDEILFRTHEVSVDDNGEIVFKLLNEYEDESTFIEWWASIKCLAQSKGLVEAKPRQALTVFDGIIEKHGYSWGGNIDGFVLKSNDSSVGIILELRQSRKTPVSKYDPAKYFLGTAYKGGDFKTWLPIIYLKKAYDLPVVLITLSTISLDEIGYTEVLSINTQKLFYVDDIPPTSNVTKDIDQLIEWMKKLME